MLTNMITGEVKIDVTGGGSRIDIRDNLTASAMKAGAAAIAKRGSYEPVEAYAELVERIQEAFAEKGMPGPNVDPYLTIERSHLAVASNALRYGLTGTHFFDIAVFDSRSDAKLYADCATLDQVATMHEA